jgi:hypothetical protein
LKNATYKGIYDEPVTLKDGDYESQTVRPDGPKRPRVGLLPATLVTGDINGDGTPETVVLLWEASGGSGVFTHVAVVSDKGGKAENIATARIGDREQVQSISIAGQDIVRAE